MVWDFGGLLEPHKRGSEVYKSNVSQLHIYLQFKPLLHLPVVQETRLYASTL